MRVQFLFSTAFIAFVCAIASSCQKETTISEGEISSSSNSSHSNAKDRSKRVYVTNVGELYAAVNDPGNAGTTIVLNAGTYMLSPSYPKGGRLDLLHDMSLIGQPGRAEAVIIDVTNLPTSSLTLPTIPGVPAPRVGAIRVGDGSNTIEWITFQNDPAHSIRSLIQTDIIATPVAQIRIAHCIIQGSSIGVSLVNREPAANGRTIEAELEDNEIRDNTIPQFGSGIQIQNSMAVNDAVIRVTLRRNYIHGNKAGILAFNASSQRCVVAIKSYTDQIEGNGLGLMFNGGFIESAISQNNSLKFEAYGSTIKNNAGVPAPPFSFPAGGIHAAAGQAMPPFAPAGTSHHNSLDIRFYGCAIEYNIGTYQLNAYGAHSFHASLTAAGTYNTSKVYLHGSSANAIVNVVNSIPAQPAETNTATVYR